MIRAGGGNVKYDKRFGPSTVPQWISASFLLGKTIQDARFLIKEYHVFIGENENKHRVAAINEVERNGQKIPVTGYQDDNIVRLSVSINDLLIVKITSNKVDDILNL